MCTYMHPLSHSDRCSRPAVYASQDCARLATHYYTSTRETIHGSQLIISRPPGNLYTARNSLLHVHKGIYTRLATHYLPSSREILHGLHLIITRPPGRLYTARNSLFPIHQGIFTRLATLINIKWTRLVQSTTILKRRHFLQQTLFPEFLQATYSYTYIYI